MTTPSNENSVSLKTMSLPVHSLFIRDIQSVSSSTQSLISVPIYNSPGLHGDESLSAWYQWWGWKNSHIWEASQWENGGCCCHGSLASLSSQVNQAGSCWAFPSPFSHKICYRHAPGCSEWSGWCSLLVQLCLAKNKEEGNVHCDGHVWNKSVI